MTLILNYASPPYYVLQMGDRRITYRRPDGTTARTTAANKNLIYLTDNAIVSIGFTGLAELYGKTTDRWIAEALMPETIPNQGSAVIRVGPPARPPNIGLAILLLCQQLDELFSRLPETCREAGLDIAFVGWQLSNRRLGPPRPLIAGLSYSQQHRQFQILQRARNWHQQKSPSGKQKVSLVAIPGINFGQRESRKLIERLAECWQDDAESLMAEAIRGVASRLDEVSPECTSVLLPNPAISREIRVRYIPATPTGMSIPTDEGPETIPVAYTPWLISPRLVHEPAVLSGGGHNVALGPYNVLFEAPNTPPDSNTLFYIGPSPKHPTH